MLAQVEPGDAEAEKGDLLAQAMEFAFRQERRAIRAQAFVDEIQQLGQFAGFKRGGFRRIGFQQPRRLFGILRADQFGPHAGEGETVGLVRVTVMQSLDVGIGLVFRSD